MQRFLRNNMQFYPAPSMAQHHLPSAKKRCLPGLAVMVLLFSVWAVAWPSRGAENPSSPDSPQGITFRRVFVPVDQPKQWPRDVRYVPIDRAEFEKLLATIAGAGQMDSSHGATIAAAEYQARLTESALLAGEATWRIVHRGKGVARLELRPCGLAISSAHWAEDQGRSVPIGLAPGGQLAALIDRSGKMQLRWSLAGKASDDATAIVFHLQLPQCPVNRLSLDLPDHLVPEPDVGYVQPADYVDESVRRWQINLGGHCRVQLRVVQADKQLSRPPAPLVRQNVVYHLDPQGLSVSVELRLDAVFAPLERIEMKLAPGLQLTEARLGDADLTCTPGKASDGSATAVLTFPVPIDDNGRVLSIRAVAPLPIGAAYRLPAIVFKDVSWQSGTIKLVVDGSLVLKRLAPVEARQMPGDPLLGWTQLQCFSPQATAEVLLALREPVLHVTSGTSLTLSTGETVAKVIADLSASGGAVFTAEAELWPAWQIDSIDSVPPGAIEDWSVGKSEAARRRVSIRLAKALAHGQVLRIAVTARRLRSPLKQELTWDDLIPLRLAGTVGQPGLVAIRAAEPYRLRLSGTERLKRVDYRTLTPAQRELLAELPRGVVFEDDAGAHDLRVSLESRRPTYSADISVEAEVRSGWVRETYAVRCTPQAGAVNRVLVCMSQRREKPIQWASLPDNKLPVTGRLLTAEAQSPDADRGKEIWELLLPRPVNTPFEIRGWRETPFTGQTAISLAALPEATTQEARVAVFSPVPKSVRLRNEGLVRLAPELSAQSQLLSTCGAYRYDPVGDVLDEGGRLWVSAAEDDPTVGGLVWLAHLQSFYEADGAARHAACYRIQNTGCRTVRMGFPGWAEADNVELWVDNDRAACRWQDDGAQRQLVVELPPGQKLVTVSVGFATPPRPLGATGFLDAPLPELDLPIVSQYWTVWLPPGYAASYRDPRWPRLSDPSPTILQRLLGPLARSAEAELFDPLNPRSWPIPGPSRARNSEAAEKAQAVLQWLGTMLADGSPSAQWGILIGSNMGEAPSLRLFVDSQALAEIGITPQTLAPPLKGSRPVDRAVRLLQSSRLALLLCGNCVVLTSAAQCALWHPWLEALEFPNVFRVKVGPLADLLEQAAEPGDPALVEADVWINQPAQSRPPWSIEAPPARTGLPLEARPCYRLAVSSAAEARLAYAHLPTMRMLGATAFLLSMVVCRWKAAARRKAVLVGVAVLAAAALVLPHWYFLAASGAMLGCLTHLAWTTLLRSGRTVAAEYSAPARTDPAGNGSRNGVSANYGTSTAEIATTPESFTPANREAPAEDVASDRKSDSGAAGGTLAGGSLAIVALVWSALASAGEPGQQYPQPGKVYQLLIPVDDQQRPAGDKYYLPEKMYEDLSRLAAAVRQQQQGWLLAGASYRGQLIREAGAEKYRIEQLQAVFELQVLGEAMQVRLPLRRDEVSLAPDAATLDGRPVQLTWEPDGAALVVEVAQPGRHFLELILEPVARNADSSTGIEISIPPVATSTLEVFFPAGAPTVSVPSAIGEIHYQDEVPQLIAELGPTDRLCIRWTGTAAPVSSPALEVEQVGWLRVKPGAVELSARLRLRAPEGQVRQLRLLADPRLRLLPPPSPDGPKAEPGPESDGLQSIVLSWDQPLPERTTLELTFRVSGSLGVGNITLPTLLVPDAKTVRQSVAVTVDPSLEHKVLHNAGWEPMELRDFLVVWGKAAAAPTAAFRQSVVDGQTGTAGQPDLVLALRPRAAQTTLQDQVLRLTCSEEEIAVDYRASILTEGESELQLRLVAPQGLAPSSISLVQDEMDRVASWSQPADGQIDVFLTARISGRSQLMLRGRLPSALRKKQPLPLVCLEQHERTPITVLIYRTSPVQVLLAKSAALTELDPASVNAPVEHTARLVHCIRAEASQLPHVGFVVVANRPEVRAEQVTWFYRQGDAWMAELDCRLSVSGGVLDQLCVEAPVNFTLLLPTEANRLYSPPGEPQVFVLPMPQPVAGEHRLRLSGTMIFAAGERVSAPAMHLKSAAKLRRLLALPRQVQGQAVTWETRGLRPAEPPETLAPPAAIGPVDFYEVTEDVFHAVFRPGVASRTPRVALADIRCAWQTDGAYQGVAVFDVEPGKADRILLQVPDDCRLLGVDIDGVPSAPIQADSKQSGYSYWVLQVGPSKVWQRIAVSFAGKSQQPLTHGKHRLASPMLAELPVAETLWSVMGPADQFPDVSQIEASIPHWQAEIVRLKHLAAVLYAGSALSDDDARLLTTWYRTWAARMVSVRRAAESQLLAAGRSRAARAAMVELRTISQEQSQLANRLGVVPVLEELFRETPVAIAREELWAAMFRSATNQACYRFAGSAPQLVVSYRVSGAGDVPIRWLLAVGLLGSVLAVAIAAPSGRLPAKVASSIARWAAGYPHVLLAGLGLVWWLWLNPSVLGLAVMVLSVFLAIRPVGRSASAASLSSIARMPVPPG